jgi:predicted permease
MPLLERAALALIRIAVPRSEREWILGDTDEELARVAAARGRRAARTWLYGEALRTVAGAARLRTAFRPASRMPHGDAPMRALFNDVRYAARWLRQAPAFTTIAVLTLAVGIGTNVTIFSLVHGVLIEPLPYASPERLVRVFDADEREPKWPMAPGNFHEYRSRVHAFESLAAYERADLQLEGDRPEQLRGMRVTPGFFATLGWTPALGRDFRAEEEQPGGGDVAILSHGLFERRFGGDRSIVGRTVRLSGRPFLIAGIMPRAFQHVGGTYRSYGHGNTVDIWWVRTIRPVPLPQDRNQHYLNVVGRLRAGITLDQARQDLAAAAQRLAREYPDSNAGWTARAMPLRDEIVGETEPMLFVLLAAVQLVLLLACVNVAGLLLGRAARRGREIGVRAALGATRLRLVRQLIVESLVLALAGGALGVALAAAVIRLVPIVGPEGTPRLDAVALNWTVVLYALAATIVTAVLFGLAPAVQLSRSNMNDALKHSGRGAAASTAPRLRGLLVAAEIALAFVLMVGAGLLLRSFAKLTAVDPGFDASGVLTARISLPPARYEGVPDAAAFFTRLIDRVRAIPGVREAGLGSDLPWTGYDENTNFGIAGRSFPPREGPEARFHMVTAGYFEAIGVPLLAGRAFSRADNANAPRTVVINNTLARTFWGTPEAAVGAQLDLWGATRIIVGVVGDVRDTPWAEAAEAALYFPQSQQFYGQDMLLAVSVEDVDPSSVGGAVAAAVREIDPLLPISNVATLESVAGAAMAARRFLMWLVGAFAATALFLAIVGVYGVAAQAVSLRLQEFGVRQALGAAPMDILWIVLRSAAGVGAAGVAAGVIMAAATTRVLASVLYGIGALDPLTFAGGALVLMAAALLGSSLPARRASRLAPAEVLRSQ